MPLYTALSTGFIMPPFLSKFFLIFIAETLLRSANCTLADGLQRIPDRHKSKRVLISGTIGVQRLHSVG